MRNTRILLIDEDVKQLFLTKTKLQQSFEDYEVEIAAGGQEALDKISRQQFDCIVSSVDRHTLNDGLALSKTLKSLHIDVPVIYLSDIQDGTSPRLEDDQITIIADKISAELARSADPAPSQTRSEEDSLTQLRNSLQDSSSVTMLLSPDGLTVEQCTAAAEKLFKPEHFMETRFQQIPLALLIAQHDRARMRTFIRDVIRNETAEASFSFVNADLDVISLPVRAVRAAHEGNLINIVLYIDEQKKERS